MSIDEIIYNYFEYRTRNDDIYFHLKIPPDDEFWGFCSCLQVWDENNYATHLLPNEFAFSLLEKLRREGDPRARKVIKEEIVTRIKKGELRFIYFLIERSYLKNLDKNEIKLLLKK